MFCLLEFLISLLSPTNLFRFIAVLFQLDEVYAASYRNRIKIEASKEQSMPCAKETRTLERAICRMKLENAENKAEWEEEKRILAINLDHERKKVIFCVSNRYYDRRFLISFVICPTN